MRRSPSRKSTTVNRLNMYLAEIIHKSFPQGNIPQACGVLEQGRDLKSTQCPYQRLKRIFIL